MYSVPSQINRALFFYLNGFAGASPGVDRLIVFCADTLGFVLFFGLVIFLFSREHKRQGYDKIITVLAASILAFGFAELIKYTFPFPRPFASANGSHQLVGFDYRWMDSFPSAHAAFFSAPTAVYFYHKRIGIFFIVGAFVIGVGRVMAGVHWPIDIAAGFVLGGGIAPCVYFGYISLFGNRKR